LKFQVRTISSSKSSFFKLISIYLSR
jgi:hypothetical protein